MAVAEVTEVVLVGRRGPAQAAFTNPELLEFGELSRADVIVDPQDLELDPLSAAWLESDAAAGTVRRNVEILRGYAARTPSGRTHRVVLKFLRSPLQVLGSERVEGIRLAVNRIAERDGRLVAVPVSETETLACGLVLRSIGYRGVPLPGVPFDSRTGVIRNLEGRVIGDDGRHLTGEYAVGWIKRGPSGVIGTNKKCATETVAVMLQDAERGALNEPDLAAGGDEIAAWLRGRVASPVTWEGWRRIDAHEMALGEPQGRPRVKLVRVADMRDIAGGVAAMSR